jgi:uncharacterized OB-fold protein
VRSGIRPQEHWRAKKFRYRLEVLRCASCGTVNMTPRKVCRRCRSTSLVPERLPESARLVAFTEVKSTTDIHDETAPYLVGLLEFEDGTRIVAQLTDVDYEELRPGMEMEAVVRKIAQEGESGIIVYGFKFRPVIT